MQRWGAAIASSIAVAVAVAGCIACRAAKVQKIPVEILTDGLKRTEK